MVRARPLQLEEGTGDAGGAGGVRGAGAVDVAPPYQRAAEEGGLRPVRPVPDGGALREVRAAYGCLGQEEAGEAAAVGFEGACRYSVAGILTPTAARQDLRSYP